MTKGYRCLAQLIKYCKVSVCSDDCIEGVWCHGLKSLPAMKHLWLFDLYIQCRYSGKYIGATPLNSHEYKLSLKSRL